MSDVKRYEAVHLRYDENSIYYCEGCEVEVVRALLASHGQGEA